MSIDTGKRETHRKQADLGRAMRTTLLMVIANAALAAVKGVAGLMGNSSALVADAMESVMDVVKSLVILGGITIAVRPPDEDHPYGHGKAEPLAAVVVAMAVMVGAAALAVRSAQGTFRPGPAPAPYTLAVLLGVVVVKEVMYRVMRRVGSEVNSTAMHSGAWDNRSDAITSMAAFIGISVALVGGEGYEVADHWAALFACGVIGYNGYRVLRPALAEIMDTAPDPAIETRVREVAVTIPGVKELDVCWVRKMGFDYFVDLHVLVPGETTVHRGHAIAHEVKDAVRLAIPGVRDVLVHVEPSEGQVASEDRLP